MSVTIELSPGLEADLADRAARLGLRLEDYIRDVIEQHVAPAPIPSPHGDPVERAKAFEDWVREFPYRRTTPLPDEAIARESFYARGSDDA